MSGTRDPSHFARLYQSNPDPWGFETSPYEQEKYRHTLSVLPDRRFTAALEIGCSIGVLTHMLAERCDALLGLDIVNEPLAAAAKRCATQPWVQFLRRQVPNEWPAGRFDLIVLSEVLYFLAPPDIDRCAQHAKSSLMPNANILLVNWLGHSNAPQSGDPCSGDEAAERFIAASTGTLTVQRQERREHYRLDLLTSPDPIPASARRTK